MSKTMAFKARQLVAGNVTKKLAASNVDKGHEVVLKLWNRTCKNRPGSEIIACYGHGRPNSRDRNLEYNTIESLGYFDNTVNADGKRMCLLNIDKIRRYMVEGCQTTLPVWRLLGMSGVFPVHPDIYERAAMHQYKNRICPPAAALIQGDKTKAERALKSIKKMESDTFVFRKPDHRSTNAVKEFVRGEEVTTAAYDAMQNCFRMLTKQETTLNHIEKARFQTLYMNTYWKHHHYFKFGYAGGSIYNFNPDKLRAQAIADKEREFYWYKRVVRKTKIPDPFEYTPPRVLRRPGENTALLNKSKLN